jgi:hypothetical protein
VYLFDSLATGGRPRVYGELILLLSHQFFGTGHLGNSDIQLSPTRHTSYVTGYSVNNGNAFGNFLGFEKMRLGWLDDTKDGGLRTLRADENDVTVSLADPSLVRKGAVHLLRIPLPPSEQYLLLESRGWKGSFEARSVPYNGPQARLVPGVLVSHIIQEKAHFAKSRIRIVCADGRFRWKAIRMPLPWQDWDPNTVIGRDSADAANGYDEREKLVVEGAPGRFWLAGYWSKGKGNPAALGPYPDCTNCVDTLTDAADNVGDRYDLFQPGDVLSPWSNPTLSLWDGHSFVLPEGPPMAVHFMASDEKTGSYTVRVLRGDLSSLPPSRPTGLIVTRDSGGCPPLRWSPNQEPSMIASNAPGTYLVERSFDGTKWQKLTGLPHPALSYEDRCSAYPADAGYVSFRLVARDRHGRVSRPSEPQRVSVR